MALAHRPPRGRFSHLAMFRIGSLLFIPAYLTVTMYRGFASSNDEGSFILMAGMIWFLYPSCFIADSFMSALALST
jgi:hypothetical protein